MPTHMAMRMFPEELRPAKLHEPFSFTKGCPVLKIPSRVQKTSDDLPNGEEMLFDVLADPHQTTRLHDEAVRRRMREALAVLMRECDAPAETYARYGLE